ncbi:MAG TPA: hypothetical protein VIT65_09400 [Microlunatus sp.]
MTSIHWRLISEEAASATHLMMQVVSFAETIRLVPRAAEAGASVETLNEALHQLALRGIARHVQPVTLPPTPSDVARVSDGVIAALQDSPLPQAEWPAIAEILGDDELAVLVNVSASSLNRYRSGERTTPDPVAARLHFAALVVSDLAGSYNDFGIRRWFRRPRSALGGSSPRELLTGDWSPDGREATQVRELARALLGASIG